MKSENLKIKSSFDKSLFSRVLIAWRSKDFTLKSENLISLLAVSIYFDKIVFKKELEVAREVLEKKIKDDNSVNLYIQKIELKLDSYIKDYSEYLKDRDYVFKVVADNIELYNIMIEVFEADGDFGEEEQKSKKILIDEYDKKFEEKN